MNTEKFELIKNILMDKRDAYTNDVNDFIDASVANDDITEDEAAELRMIF